MSEQIIQNQVKCSKCDAGLTIECSQSVGSVYTQCNGGFFPFECPICHGWNGAVQLTGQAIVDIRPDTTA